MIVPACDYGWPMAGSSSILPALSWTPSIGASDMIVYTGTRIPELAGDALIAAGDGLVRVRFNGSAAREIQRIPLGMAVRTIAQVNGDLWVLETGGSGRLASYRRAPDRVRAVLNLPWIIANA